MAPFWRVDTVLTNYDGYAIMVENTRTHVERRTV